MLECGSINPLHANQSIIAYEMLDRANYMLAAAAEAPIFETSAKAAHTRSWGRRRGIRRGQGGRVVSYSTTAKKPPTSHTHPA